MSHFTVLVVGENPEKQLQPYHEYECTGTEDEYVIDVDVTDELKKNYEKDTVTRWRDADGIDHDPYEDRFYREMTAEERKKISPLGFGGGHGVTWNSKDWGDGLGYRAKIHLKAEEIGMTEHQIPQSQLRTLSEFAKYWGNYIERDGRFYKHTNPNAKWDWYVLGGRWPDKLLLKSGGKTSQAYMRDIDWKTIRDRAGEEARIHYRAAREFFGDLPEPLSWDHCVAEFNGQEKQYDKARDMYWAQPAPAKFKTLSWKQQEELNLQWLDWDFSKLIHHIYRGETHFVDRARRNSVNTFAVIKDGKWYEKGEMGWFGVAHDEKDEEVWINEFNSLIESLSPDTLLSVYDCHI